jgi:hypothetical protein
MRKRLLYALLAAGLVLIALVAFTSTATAEKRSFQVRLADGHVVTVTVDVPPGTPVDEIPLPGELIAELPGPDDVPAAPSVPGAPPSGGGGGDNGSPGGPSGGGSDQPHGNSSGSDSGGDHSPRSHHGHRQDDSGTKRHAHSDDPNAQGQDEGSTGSKKKRHARHSAGNRLRRPDGAPARSNPGFFDALPGPTTVNGVPNFVIRKFRVPLFLLPIYQAAGIQYGVRWEYLAAINEIETDYGRNLNVSSAGAVGWMQFMPATWRQWGVDANDDKKKDPFNPVDAIFASARYLKAAGAPKDMRKAIFAYNHADWYVDSVMLRARLIAGLPSDLVGSLTGLTEGRFPIAARAQYADDLNEKAALKRVKKGHNAANIVGSNDNRRSIQIFAQEGSPVVAVNDGVIKKIGVKNGRKFIVLQDAYGNRYTYQNLGSVSRFHPVPKNDAGDPTNGANAISANDSKDPKPTQPASAGRQVSQNEGEAKGGATAKTVAKSAPAAPRAQAVVKQRLFAHPDRPNARKHGGVEQTFDHDQKSGAKSNVTTYRNYFARGLSLSSRDAKLKRLKKGSRVIAGTILGRVGARQGTKAANIDFSIRPAGRGAPSIDPKPILDGWKLLESTAIYRASGKNALYGKDGDSFSIGQILLLPKPLLEKRVLSDERVEIYPGGRQDIKTGQIDRRVLATLEYLAESGLRPTVSCLKNGHSFLTSSGNVSQHSSGNAVDISKLNGVPILGHQDKGGIAEQGVDRLMLLQGTMRPDQIISLMDKGQNTLALSDHDDHIHVGFRPLFGDNKKLGQQAMAVLKPGQWNDLIGRLRKIDNPTVSVNPSKYAIPVKPRRSSDAHRGE